MRPVDDADVASRTATYKGVFRTVCCVDEVAARTSGEVVEATVAGDVVVAGPAYDGVSLPVPPSARSWPPSRRAPRLTPRHHQQRKSRLTMCRTPLSIRNLHKHQRGGRPRPRQKAGEELVDAGPVVCDGEGLPAGQRADLEALLEDVYADDAAAHEACGTRGSTVYSLASGLADTAATSVATAQPTIRAPPEGGRTHAFAWP